jgi:AbrB family looped-hinge helix DNA binding protein
MAFIIDKSSEEAKLMPPQRLTLPTNAARIRELAREGLPRAEIARRLSIRYQQVRNVLERDEQRAEAAASRSEEATTTFPTAAAKVKLGPDGRVVIPAPFREALGLKESDVLFARLENGEIHLLTPKAAMRRAQAIVRQFVPEGVSLVDELIADRREEAARERQRG